MTLLPHSVSHHLFGCRGRKLQACFGKSGVAGGLCEPPGRDALPPPAQRQDGHLSAPLPAGRPAPWALQGRSWVGASGPRPQCCLALTIGHGAVLCAAARFLPSLASTLAARSAPVPAVTMRRSLDDTALPVRDERAHSATASRRRTRALLLPLAAGGPAGPSSGACALPGDSDDLGRGHQPLLLGPPARVRPGAWSCSVHWR